MEDAIDQGVVATLKDEITAADPLARCEAVKARLRRLAKRKETQESMATLRALRATMLSLASQQEREGGVPASSLRR